MGNFYLSEQAEQDLMEIWDFCAATWDKAYADKQLKQIEICCGNLAGDFKKAKQPLAAYPQLRMAKFRHHYVFYVAYNPPLVIAVLHDKMEFMEGLREQL